ncbi:MAG: PBP1A family penicillin-binding protein [Deltaproteobacteria bacterium]|nr:PBP1A family penicillin-binding protein [Deltaproteobacteria bacterium]
MQGNGPKEGPKTVQGIKKRRASGRWGWRLLYIFLTVLVLCAGTLTMGYFYFTHDLPKLFTVEDYNPPVISRVYDVNQRLVGEFYREMRDLAPLSKMPDLLIKAFVAAEDDRFFQHPGIDLTGILRAVIKNIVAGRKIQGGSTITQQVTRSLLLSPEKSYTRKIKELILAYRIENRLSKEDILYIYLNQIYLGHGAYGVEAASHVYFGKSVGDLNLAECALLAGLPRAPNRYSPIRDPEKAGERQAYVLRRMVEEGYITQAQADAAKAGPLRPAANGEAPFDQAPYFTEYVRRHLEEVYGATQLFEGGLRVYTTLDLRLQEVAQEAIQRGVDALDKRIGYRGPIESVAKNRRDEFCSELLKQDLKEGEIVHGLVTGVDDKNQRVTVCLGQATGIIEMERMKWARKPNPEIASDYAAIKKPSQALKSGDHILVKVLAIPDKETPAQQGAAPKPLILALEQEPEPQAALLCMDGYTGEIRAMVGGTDFRKSQFNRATQAKRQPGSAFKPFIYAAAIDKGFTPVSVIIDSPIVFDDPVQKEKWKPMNYEMKFFGPTLFREALIHSRNVVTVKLLQAVGVDYVINYAKNMGIESELGSNLSLGLGSSEVTLLELVKSYGVFASGGLLLKPMFIDKIVNRKGETVEKNLPEKRRVISDETAFIMTHLMTEVVKYGTGRSVQPLERPAAGKTGTTNDLKDAWFIGYTPELITGVWVGFDQFQSMGRFETGSRAASPIWLDFMKEALKNRSVTPFSPPGGVTFAKIDPESGKLASADTRNPVFECFKVGTEPTERADKKEEKDLSVDFFKTNL